MGSPWSDRRFNSFQMSRVITQVVSDDTAWTVALPTPTVRHIPPQSNASCVLKSRAAPPRSRERSGNTKQPPPRVTRPSMFGCATKPPRIA